MKLVVGLGNPEEKYSQTRHNVGFMFIDFLKENQDFVTLKSENFMNSSGEFVREKVDFYKISPSELFIVHDDLDISLGEYKIQFGKGPKLHNGIISIEKHLKTPDFWRIRIGVDNRDSAKRTPGEAYVLQNFSLGESKTLKSVFEKIKVDLEKNGQ